MLGVLANSDGRSEIVRAAVEQLVAGGADLVVHCGDVGGRHVLDEIATLGGAFVWGDRDHDRTGLMRYAKKRGIICFGVLGDFAHARKRIVMVHGDDKSIVKKLIDEQEHDFILTGHAAGALDETFGKTRLINPGSIYGNTPATALLLDPLSGNARTVTL